MASGGAVRLQPDQFLRFRAFGATFRPFRGGLPPLLPFRALLVGLIIGASWGDDARAGVIGVSLFVFSLTIS